MGGAVVIRLNPSWDPGLAIVDPADLCHLVAPEKLREYLELREQQVAAVDRAIEVNGEVAAVEALRRRHVLVEEVDP
jgi:hypothetical protein